MVVRRRGMPAPAQKTRLHLPKPECLTGFAGEHWDYVIPKLLSMGVLDESGIDRESLVAMCQWWGEYRNLQEKPAAEPGENYKRSISLASCFKNWTGLADRFGLNPKAREKMTLHPDEHDPAAEFVQ